MTARYRQLLWLAVGLASVRFIIFPWFDLQADWRDQLDVLTQRLDRSEALLASQAAIEQTLSRVRKEHQTLFIRFPVATDDESFKREAQQSISTIATELGLRVTYFDWLEAVDSVDELDAQRVRMTVEGGMRSLALFQGELEARMPHLFIRGVSYDLRTPIGGSWEFPSSATWTFDLHYRQGGAK